MKPMDAYEDLFYPPVGTNAPTVPQGRSGAWDQSFKRVAPTPSAPKTHDELFHEFTQRYGAARSAAPTVPDLQTSMRPTPRGSFSPPLPDNSAENLAGLGKVQWKSVPPQYREYPSQKPGVLEGSPKAGASAIIQALLGMTASSAGGRSSVEPQELQHGRFASTPKPPGGIQVPTPLAERMTPQQHVTNETQWGAGVSPSMVAGAEQQASHRRHQAALRQAMAKELHNRRQSSAGINPSQWHKPTTLDEHPEWRGFYE